MKELLLEELRRNCIVLIFMSINADGENRFIGVFRRIPAIQKSIISYPLNFTPSSNLHCHRYHRLFGCIFL